MPSRCLQAAVDIAVSVRGSYEEYRPHESPANSNIQDRAVVAGGILLDLVTGDHSTSRPRSADFDHVSPEPPRTPFKPLRGSSTTREDLTTEAVAQIS